MSDMAKSFIEWSIEVVEQKLAEHGHGKPEKLEPPRDEEIYVRPTDTPTVKPGPFPHAELQRWCRTSRPQPRWNRTKRIIARRIRHICDHQQ